MRGFRSNRYQPRKRVQPKRQKVAPLKIRGVPRNIYPSPPYQHPLQPGQFPSPVVGQQKPFLSPYGPPPPYQIPPLPLPPPPVQPIIEQEVSWPATVRLDDASFLREDDFQAFAHYEKIQPKRRRPLTKVEKGVLAFCTSILVLSGISALFQFLVFPTQGTQNASQTSTVTVRSTPTPKPTLPPTPTPIPDNHSSLGQTLTGVGWQITINSVQESMGDGITAPNPGDRFLVLNVTGKYIASDSEPLIYPHFSLLDSPSTDDDVGLGFEYDQVYLSNSVSFYGGIPTNDTSMSYGQIVQGDVAFEVPSAKHGFDLYYWQPSSEDTGKLGWYIPL